MLVPGIALYKEFLLTLGVHAQEGYCSCLVCVCVGFGVYKERRTYTQTQECGRLLSAQLPRHQNRPNPNATETNTPVYLHVAEYTCRFNSGHQGSSLSFIMNCMFRPL